MSPWVVEFGRRTFGVQIHLGPIEELDVPRGSLDAILMMDVLEHLPDPVATLTRCAQLLKPDGVLLIQTPQYREGTTYGQMVEARDPFLDQLKPEEHLYLFTDRGLRRLLAQAGMAEVRFEPAIFAHYDMFVVAGRAPLQPIADEAVESALLGTPGGRLTLALLDLRKREQSVLAELAKARSDVRFLIGKASEAQAGSTGDAQARLAQLQADFAGVEADRVARGEVIEQQGGRIAGLEAEVHSRLQELNGAYAELEDLRRRRADLEERNQGLQRDLDALRESLASAHERVEQRDRKIADIEGELRAGARALADLRGEMQSHERTLAELIDSLRSHLEARQAALEKLEGSMWYRIGSKLRLI
jgi:predicted  nucleic acid-binding Zn-ribbon protein